MDIDRRKYPDWLRHGPRRPQPIAILQVPKYANPAQLDMMKQRLLEKGYHIVMRPERSD